MGSFQRLATSLAVGLCFSVVTLPAFAMRSFDEHVAGSTQKKDRDDTRQEDTRHMAWDALLKQHVDAHGLVDYAALRNDTAVLDRYLASLVSMDFRKMSRDERLAAMINAYNAFTLKLILDYYPVESINDIPESKRWKHRRWKLAGSVWSLDGLEHQGIRKEFKEPRIHFALVCAAVGCPKLRNEAYVGHRLEEQLETQTEFVHSNDTWFVYQEGDNTVYLTKLYEWYGDDFSHLGGPVAFAAKYSQPLARRLKKGKPKVAWLEYDWSLNKQRSNREDS